MSDLNELIYLLSCRQLDDEAVAECADDVRAADEDKELDWIEETVRRQQFTIQSILWDWIAMSDKIDEFHEQLMDIFDHPLPPFPYHENKMDFLPLAYFKWLDDELAARGDGYELLLWDCGFDDNLHGFVVLRADMSRILSLSEAMGFTASRPMDDYAKYGIAP